MEFGWPSQGYNRQRSVPTATNQAELIRGFLIEADRRDARHPCGELDRARVRVGPVRVEAEVGRLLRSRRDVACCLSGFILE